MSEVQNAVYAVRHPHGFYKIGKSQQPTNRYMEMRSYCPYDLELYAVLSTPGNGFDTESAIHQQLDAYGWKGEWFNVPKEILDNLFESYAARDGYSLQRVRLNNVDATGTDSGFETPEL